MKKFITITFAIETSASDETVKNAIKKGINREFDDKHIQFPVNIHEDGIYITPEEELLETKVFAVNSPSALLCHSCAFRDKGNCNDTPCLSEEREDKRNVYFIKAE